MMRGPWPASPGSLRHGSVLMTFEILDNIRDIETIATGRGYTSDAG